MEPVWSESTVHSTGASILDPITSSNASEPIEASEAGELAGKEQVESAVSCVIASSVAGDTAEASAAVRAEAAVKPRIEPSAAGELAEARAAGEPAEACAAGAAGARHQRDESHRARGAALASDVGGAPRTATHPRHTAHSRTAEQLSQVTSAVRGPRPLRIKPPLSANGRTSHRRGAASVGRCACSRR